MNDPHDDYIRLETIEDLDFYSIRENFLHDSLYVYLPEAEQFTMLVKPEDTGTAFSDEFDQLVYSMKLTHFWVKTYKEAWPIFLEAVENGFLALEEKGVWLTGETRCKMLLAASLLEE